MRVIIGSDDLALFLRKNCEEDIQNASFNQFMASMAKRFPHMMEAQQERWTLWQDKCLPTLPLSAWQYSVNVEFVSTLYSMALRELASNS
ncbi:hypothetical protein [Thaumasiovibrio subtropicus]|uniref:hypothetical protein n=1 Tax=Thaumasiovibrio subtropicus TaxID=1891207 RepID=UPI000B35683E|nr:hypothetical protein [Thaumasiovibrio subtropicus]